MNSIFETAGASHSEGPGFATLTVPNRVESIRPAAEFIVSRARAMSAEGSSHVLFEAAVVEALTNALKHGNTAARPDASILCEVEVVDRVLTVRVFDEGKGFKVPEPMPYGRIWQGQDAAAIPASGFGLSIIRAAFPSLRATTRAGHFGIEMTRTF
jgi:anti-sigma regulatory factor (Ser/Thr protein kinase)